MEPFSVAEVEAPLNSMKPDSALGPLGFLFDFFMKFWKVVKGWRWLYSRISIKGCSTHPALTMKWLC